MLLKRCTNVLRSLFTSILATYATAFTFLAWFVVSANAGGAPPQLLNKTITISFLASGNFKNRDGQLRPFGTTVSEIIYVSTAGRIFRRIVIANGTGTQRGDTAPGDRSGPWASYQFQGNKLVGVAPWEGGARQITATFDAGFTSCTASVIEGHGPGGIIRRKGPDGGIYEVTSATTSSPRCSIQSGNAFAN